MTVNSQGSQGQAQVYQHHQQQQQQGSANPGVPQYGNQGMQGYGNNQANQRRNQPMTVNSQMGRNRQPSLSEKMGLMTPKVETIKMADFEKKIQFANQVIVYFGALVL
jgi:hypothetical protein